MAEFQRGDMVEVCSKEDGFVGSHFEARVMKRLDDGKSYSVQYKNLVEEDGVTPLIEIVSADEVRPRPPKPRMSSVISGLLGFHKVDAFDKDGWWVGKITLKQGSNYLVYFDTTGEEIAYDASRLRPHLDWINGNWIASKRRYW